MQEPEAREAAVTCEDVEGNSVYRSDGTKIGEIERFIIDKEADKITAGLVIYRIYSTRT
jgi:sporulation protein YlmC with PRC-barrel domain